MEHKTKHEALKQSESLKNILYVWKSINQNQKISIPGLVEAIGADNISLAQNQGKAPPGCSRSPGLGRGHPSAKEADRPENKGDPPDHARRPGVNSGPHRLPELVEGRKQYHNEIECINKYEISNYYKLLTFFIMKKQIFIFVFVLLAAIANVNKSFGQACTPSAITPSAGIEYTYSKTNAAGSNPTYDWYITKDVDVLASANFLTAGTMFTVNAGTPYHNSATGVDNIKITWTAAAVADGGPFYLVLRYSESSTSTPVCTVENLRVTEIKPINSFLLALEGGMLNAGNYVATAGSNACAANITAALVTAATPSVLLTYGNNTLYYVATASGIVGDWYPQIRIPALSSTQQYVSAEWSSVMTGAGPWTSFGAATTGATQDLLSASPATASVAGTPILIKIVINNNNWQTLADQAITLALDGFLPPTPIAIATSKSDVTSATDCTPLAAFGRTATFTINRRPDPVGTPAFITVTNP